MCNKLLQWKLKGVQKYQTSEDTHYSKIRSTVSVHSPQQLQRHLQQHQACRASTLTLAPSKRCSIPQRQCNQPSMDVLKEIRRACLGHNVVPSISGARPSGRRQRVRSVADQIESHNCNRHGLLCSCQQQSLHSAGGHHNIRLFKLSRLKRRRNSRFFHSHLGVHRTVKSSTSIVAVVAGSLHSNEKSLSAELRRYQGFGVDVTLLHLGFDVTDFNLLPLITNDLME